jgi:hypothetical protein
VSRTIGGWIAESEVADILRDAEKRFRDRGEIAIGSYPFFREGRVGANLVVRGPDADLVAACVADLVAALAAAGHDMVDGGI